MKSVLRSVKPYWFYLMCEGKKKVEVCKTEPLSKEWDRIVYLYCSRDMRSFSRIPEEHREKYRKYLGTVGAYFYCYGIMDISSDYAPVGSCITPEELMQYGKGKTLSGLCFHKINVFKKPRELGEFSRYGYKDIEHAGSGCVFCGNTQCKYSNPEEVIAGHYVPPICKIDGCTLKRAPQSWQYVEQVER